MREEEWRARVCDTLVFGFRTLIFFFFNESFLFLANAHAHTRKKKIVVFNLIGWKEIGARVEFSLSLFRR